MKMLVFVFGLLLATPVALAADQQRPPPKSFEGDYSISADGFGGRFRFAFTLDGDKYEATAFRRLDGLARVLVGDRQDYAYTSSGTVSDAGVKPAFYQQQGGKHRRIVRVAFKPTDVVTTSEAPIAPAPVPATREQKLGSMDLLSFFVAMTVAPGGANPCDQTIKIFDSRARFDFVMKAAGHQSYSSSAWSGQAYRCHVFYKPIAGFRKPQQPAELTFLLAPLPSGWFAPVRVEMPSEELGVITLQARSLAMDDRPIDKH